MEQYFDNMAQFSPTNQKGSCGYVSLIQYLCYYDSFYNDAIVPEKYERNQGIADTLEKAREISPGVLNKTYTSNELSKESVIENNINLDYQIYLVSKNAELTSTNWGDNGFWSTHMRDYNNLLKSVVNDSVSFSFVDSNTFGALSPTSKKAIDGLTSYVEDNLDKGKPVVVHIKEKVAMI